jgi:hypothetical protein
MSDESIVLDVYVKEYLQMRQEVVGCIQSQERILSLTITLCVGIFSIGYYLMSKDIAYYFFVSLLGPASICFIGSYWLNMAFQQKRYCMHIRDLEVQISKIIQNLSKDSDVIIHWEYYLGANHSYVNRKGQTVKFSTKAILGHQIFLGMYLTVPFFMYLFTYIDKLMELTLTEFIQFFFSNPIHLFSAIILIIVYAAFLITVVYYVRKISAIQKYIEGTIDPECKRIFIR